MNEIDENNYKTIDGFLEIIEGLVLSLENYLKYRGIYLCMDSCEHYKKIRGSRCYFFSDGSCERCFLSFKSDTYYDVLKKICKISSTPYLSMVNKIEMVLGVLSNPQPYFENNRVLKTLGLEEDMDWSKACYDLKTESESGFSLVYSFSSIFNFLLNQKTDSGRIAVLNKVIGTANREIKRIDGAKELDKKLKK